MTVTKLRYLPIACLCFIALTVLMLARASAQSGDYTFMNIDYPGAPSASTIPRGVNDSGKIVGAYTDSDGNGHGFLYDGKSYSPIDCGAFGINNSDVISGSYTDGEGRFHGCFLDENGFHQIDYPGSFVTTAYGLNNNGVIVGFTVDDFGLHGFIDNNGVFSSFNCPGAFSSIPIGINDSGQIAGYYTDSSGSTHGLFYDGSMCRPLDYPGAAQTIANGINNAGLVAGYYCNSDCTDARAFLWSAGPIHQRQLSTSHSNIWYQQQRSNCWDLRCCGGRARFPGHSHLRRQQLHPDRFNNGNWNRYQH